jgi:hypothetical protein
MYETGEAILFFIVFASQVLLLSWYFPRQAASRIRYVLEHCPPSTHPKLYARPVEHYERIVRNFVRLNRTIVVAGFLIIVGLIVGTFAMRWDGAMVTPWSTSGEWDAAIVVPFFLVQWVAVSYLEISGSRHFKALSKAPPPRVRTTQLRRRRLVDFVSPAVLVAAVVTYVGFVAFILYYKQFGFEWFWPNFNIALVTAMYLGLGLTIAITVYGRWPDHHQAQQDRFNLTRRLVWRLLAFIVATPLLIVTQLLIKLYDTEFLEPVIASAWVQVSASLLLVIYTYRVESIDFDVYKLDVRDSTTAPSAGIVSPQAGSS